MPLASLRRECLVSQSSRGPTQKFPVGPQHIFGAHHFPPVQKASRTRTRKCSTERKLCSVALSLISSCRWKGCHPPSECIRRDQCPASKFDRSEFPICDRPPERRSAHAKGCRRFLHCVSDFFCWNLWQGRSRCKDYRFTCRPFRRSMRIGCDLLKNINGRSQMLTQCGNARVAML